MATLTREEITRRVRSVVIAQLDLGEQEFTNDADWMDECGADSLALIEVVIALEEVFDIDIPDEIRFTSVDGAVEYFMGGDRVRTLTPRQRR